MDPAGQLPSVDELQRLLLETTPRIFQFSSEQTATERALLLNSIPIDARHVIREILLGYFDHLECPPSYVGSPLDPLTIIEDMVSECDSEWRLLLYTSSHGILCDFSRQVDDGEEGTGVYLEFATNRRTTIFSVQDSLLEAFIEDLPGLSELISDYEDHRRMVGVEDTDMQDD